MTTLTVLILFVCGILYIIIRTLMDSPKLQNQTRHQRSTTQQASHLATQSVTPRYRYRRKNYMMTRREHDFFVLLQKAYGADYYIFPQVRLASFVDHEVKGQSWQGAFSVIARKSVDYVICEKGYIRPLVAIELDDSSHDTYDRQQRDGLVQSILDDAHMPLVRFRHETTIEHVKDKLDRHLHTT